MDNPQEIDYYYATNGGELTQINSLRFWRFRHPSTCMFALDATDAIADVSVFFLSFKMGPCGEKGANFELSRTSRDLKNNLISTVEPGAFRGLLALRRL